MGINSQRDHLAKLAADRRVAQEEREATAMFSNLHPQSVAFDPEQLLVTTGTHELYEYNEQLARMTPTERAEYAALPAPHKALADLHWQAGYDMGVYIGGEDVDKDRDTVKRYLFSPEDCANIVNSLFFEGPIGPELTQRISDIAREWESN
jgi:hypothetical protein